MSNFKQKIIRSVSHSIVIFLLLFIRIFNHIGRLSTRWKIENGINVHVRYKLEPIITFIFAVKYGIRIETRMFYKMELQRKTKWSQLPEQKRMRNQDNILIRIKSVAFIEIYIHYPKEEIQTK